MPRGLTDEDAMALAVEQGLKGRGRTAPNPPVGAILVRGGEVVGRGFTQPAGGPHAEIVALEDCRSSGNDPCGATLYVTLEPCGHHGRTPPCTEALIRAGVERVVVGVIDPTAPMQGRSLRTLRSAGIQVDLGILAERCSRSILGWRRAVLHGLPELTLKVASSADGAIATATGESKWITGEQARHRGRRLRGEHDAILVGIGTVLADDPHLDTRIAGLPDPVPVVVDSRGRFPAGCALDRPGTLVFTAPDAPFHGVHANRLSVPRGHGGLDLERVLQILVERGLHRVLVEGGATISRSFLDAALVDRVEQFLAGALLPGGRGWVGGPPLEHLGEAVRLTVDEVVRVGPDLWIRWEAPHRLGRV